MFYKLVSTYLYIATHQALMPLLWPSGQSGSELLNSIQKYTTLASCWHNIFADSGLKAAIINGKYTTGNILKKFYFKIFCKRKTYYFTVFIVVIYTTIANRKR